MGETHAMSFSVRIDHSEKYPVIRLTNNISGCEAVILAFGALLNAFRIPSKDGLFDVIDGFSNTADAEVNIANGYKSAKLSPFVCRMNRGTYEWEGNTNIVTRRLAGEHALHGLVYDGVYTVLGQEAGDSFAFVSLGYRYNGNDKGYPFSYDLVVSWRLEAGNQLTVTTTVENRSACAIPLADGWHPYFRIGGPVDEWQLQFSEALQFVYDENLLPTGDRAKDDRFVNGCSLSGMELDNGFVFNGRHSNRCVLSNNRFRLVITPGESYPVLQLYIPPGRSSIAIENLSGAPDNFNNRIGLIVLQPGEKKVFVTGYRVETLVP